MLSRPHRRFAGYLVPVLLVCSLALVLVLPCQAVTSRNGKRPKASLKRLMNAGSQYFKRGNYSSAYKAWRMVGDKLVEKKLYQDPSKVATVAKLRYLVGFALFKAKKFQGAARYWRQTLSLVPDHPKALRGLTMLARAGKIDKEEISPDLDFPISRGLSEDDGLVDAKIPDPKPKPVDPVGDTPPPASDEPMDYLEGVEVHPDKSKAREAWDNFKSARDQGKVEQSLEELRRAFSFGKDQSEVDYELGHAFLRDEKPERAVIHFLRTLKNEEEDHREVHLALGKAHGLMEDVQKEIASYQRVLQLDPDYGEAHFMLALAYDKVKNSPKVLEHAQRAIRIDPEYKEKLKPRIKDSNVSKEIGKIVTNVLRDSKYERLTDEKIEEYAEEIGRILGEENLNTTDFVSNSKGKIKGVLNDIREGKSTKDAVTSHISKEERTQFLKAYQKSPKMKQMFKEIKERRDKGE